MKKQLVKIIASVAIAATLVFAPAQQEKAEAQVEQPVIQQAYDPGDGVRP